jgi:hypothetical protein
MKSSREQLRAEVTGNRGSGVETNTAGPSHWKSLVSCQASRDKGVNNLGLRTVTLTAIGVEVPNTQGPLRIINNTRPS